MQTIFDGHNDLLLRLWQSEKAGADGTREFLNAGPSAHIDAGRARQGGLSGGLCAMYIPSDDIHLRRPDGLGHYETPLAHPLERAASLDIALHMTAIARRLHREGHWRLCTQTRAIEEAMADGVFAAVLHLEGCEPVDRDLFALEVLHAAGLRSLGPVWSRHNIFGHGVPFAYPRSPDTGPGLTDAGFDLVRACNRLGIVIDLAHITEQGFWDVARTSDQPLVASHSNAHALTPVARNLTDRQMDAIRDTGGLAGLNFAVTMLRLDGQENTDTPLSDMIRHIDYMVERMGIDCVGIGSDFDGATIPSVIGDAAGLPRLISALKAAGYDGEALDKLCYKNWLRILAQAWKEG